VYGSLLAGGYNHCFLRSSVRMGEARTAARFELVDLGPYPALVPNGSTSVLGEVYRVDKDVLARLDQLEGHPSYYLRALVPLVDGSEVWGYVMMPVAVAGHARIPSGSWREHLQARSTT
jgi:gamma-glutamylcyclotransferase (GGCT)/AIG2-like uncharacterized protein YtfP